MGRAFDGSQQAYKSGDGARAKQLSEEGKRHKAEMEALNQQAADWIYYGKTKALHIRPQADHYIANNTDSAANEVDLHGLYVKEAVERTEQAIQGMLGGVMGGCRAECVQLLNSVVTQMFTLLLVSLY